MRTQYVILIVIGIIFALMLGSFLFGISLGFLPEESLISEIEKLYRHRIVAFLTGIFLYGVSYVVTKTLIKRFTREEVYVSENEYGRVVVSMTVVEDVIKKVLRKFEFVKKYKLHFYARGKKLNINIRIKEWEGSDIRNHIENINGELRSKLDRIVGLQDNFEVLIKIEKIQDPGWEV